MKIFNYLFFCFFFIGEIHAQYIGDQSQEEAAFYAQTKQVSQFFRRFNNEENLKGKKYDKNSKKYRSAKNRKKYLSILFDQQNLQISQTLKEEFIDHLINTSSFLDFHGGDWFAEIHTIFLYKNFTNPLTLYLHLQEENLGAKWVIKNVYFQPFINVFDSNEIKDEKFLHPLSHELGFMNLKQVFSDEKDIQQYMNREHSIDMLTLFMYEYKKGLFKFESVMDVKFHFFQIKGWYFEISLFNRSGFNTGWLISNLVKASEEEKILLQNYILRKVSK